jgi:hypothetical protein
VLGAFKHGPAAELIRDRNLLARLLDTAACKRDMGPLVEACDRQDSLLPIAGKILELAASVSSGQLQVPMSWTDYHNLTSVVGLVARLAEEAESQGQYSWRTDALNAWDTLLEAGVAHAADALDARVEQG